GTARTARSVRRWAAPTPSSWWTTTPAPGARCASSAVPAIACTMRGCRRAAREPGPWRRCRSRSAPTRTPGDRPLTRIDDRERKGPDQVAKTEQRPPGLRSRLRLPKPPRPAEAFDKVREGEIWKSVFRPGSVFRKGYKDTQRDRALATMNNVLYHLHPTKVKRHALKLTYTFCLGGLSFFLFILLTITGIYLMFFYRPAAELGSAIAYQDMQSIRTLVFFGDLVRNIHRWGAHLMVLTVTLHMARVFYTGAYKPPREFNWVVGVILL